MNNELDQSQIETLDVRYCKVLAHIGARGRALALVNNNIRGACDL